MLREIGGRAIGAEAPVFVIAEIGLNHGGSVDRALALVDAAADAGASAVKLQTLTAETLVAPSCPAPAHVTATSLQAFFATFELDDAAHRRIVARARARGLAVLSTPFSEEAVDRLEPLGLDAYKIASGDLTWDGLIRRAARTGRPLVLSTGMSTLDEVRRAVSVARDAGCAQLAVLHCVSAYPTPAASRNLRAIQTLATALDVPVGLSDHAQGVVSAIAAVALGAHLYERHLVLDDDVDAIDRAVSSTPAALRQLVADLAEVRAALGTGDKVCQPAEAPNVVPSRRGVYARRALRRGTRVAPGDLIALRPATALPPSAIDTLAGVRLAQDIPAGAALRDSDFLMEQAS
ncbi:MAG: N-acetylneuraminate synthase family protein [Vicinamibacterales bacterium]